MRDSLREESQSEVQQPQQKRSETQFSNTDSPRSYESMHHHFEKHCQNSAAIFSQSPNLNERLELQEQLTRLYQEYSSESQLEYRMSQHNREEVQHTNDEFDEDPLVPAANSNRSMLLQDSNLLEYPMRENSNKQNSNSINQRKETKEINHLQVEEFESTTKIQQQQGQQEQQQEQQLSLIPIVIPRSDFPHHQKVRFSSWQSDVRTRLYETYASSQNYYYTRDLNEILVNARSHCVIMYKDNLAFDHEYDVATVSSANTDGVTELRAIGHFKRMYAASEYPGKSKLLAEYYKFHSDIPRLFMLPQTVTLNVYFDTKRQLDYIRIAKIIEDENRLNPDRPPKGIVGDLPNHNQQDEEEEDIFGDDYDDDDYDEGEEEQFNGGNDVDRRGFRGRRQPIENVLFDVSSFINRGDDKIDGESSAITREKFDKKNQNHSAEREIYIFEQEEGEEDVEVQSTSRGLNRNLEQIMEQDVSMLNLEGDGYQQKERQSVLDALHAGEIDLFDEFVKNETERALQHKAEQSAFKESSSTRNLDARDLNMFLYFLRNNPPSDREKAEQTERRMAINDNNNNVDNSQHPANNSLQSNDNYISLAVTAAQEQQESNEEEYPLENDSMKRQLIEQQLQAIRQQAKLSTKKVKEQQSSGSNTNKIQNMNNKRSKGSGDEVNVKTDSIREQVIANSNGYTMLRESEKQNQGTQKSKQQQQQLLKFNESNYQPSPREYKHVLEASAHTMIATAKKKKKGKTTAHSNASLKEQIQFQQQLIIESKQKSNFHTVKEAQLNTQKTMSQLLLTGNYNNFVSNPPNTNSHHHHSSSNHINQEISSTSSKSKSKQKYKQKQLQQLQLFPQSPQPQINFKKATQSSNNQNKHNFAKITHGNSNNINFDQNSNRSNNYSEKPTYSREMQEFQQHTPRQVQLQQSQYQQVNANPLQFHNHSVSAASSYVNSRLITESHLLKKSKIASSNAENKSEQQLLEQPPSQNSTKFSSLKSKNPSQLNNNNSKSSLAKSIHLPTSSLCSISPRGKQSTSTTSQLQYFQPNINQSKQQYQQQIFGTPAMSPSQPASNSIFISTNQYTPSYEAPESSAITNYTKHNAATSNSNNNNISNSVISQESKKNFSEKQSLLLLKSRKSALSNYNWNLNLNLNLRNNNNNEKVLKNQNQNIESSLSSQQYQQQQIFQAPILSAYSPTQTIIAGGNILQNGHNNNQNIASGMNMNASISSSTTTMNNNNSNIHLSNGKDLLSHRSTSNKTIDLTTPKYSFYEIFKNQHAVSAHPSEYASISLKNNNNNTATAIIEPSVRSLDSSSSAKISANHKQVTSNKGIIITNSSTNNNSASINTYSQRPTLQQIQEFQQVKSLNGNGGIMLSPQHNPQNYQYNKATKKKSAQSLVTNSIHSLQQKQEVLSLHSNYNKSIDDLATAAIAPSSKQRRNVPKFDNTLENAKPLEQWLKQQEQLYSPDHLQHVHSPHHSQNLSKQFAGSSCLLSTSNQLIVAAPSAKHHHIMPMTTTPYQKSQQSQQQYQQQQTLLSGSAQSLHSSHKKAQSTSYSLLSTQQQQQYILPQSHGIKSARDYYSIEHSLSPNERDNITHSHFDQEDNYYPRNNNNNNNNRHFYSHNPSDSEHELEYMIGQSPPSARHSLNQCISTIGQATSSSFGKVLPNSQKLVVQQNKIQLNNNNFNPNILNSGATYIAQQQQQHKHTKSENTFATHTKRGSSSSASTAKNLIELIQNSHFSPSANTNNLNAKNNVQPVVPSSTKSSTKTQKGTTTQSTSQQYLKTLISPTLMNVNKKSYEIAEQKQIQSPRHNNQTSKNGIQQQQQSIQRAQKTTSQLISLSNIQSLSQTQVAIINAITAATTNVSVSPRTTTINSNLNNNNNNNIPTTQQFKNNLNKINNTNAVGIMESQQLLQPAPFLSARNSSGYLGSIMEQLSQQQYPITAATHRSHSGKKVAQNATAMGSQIAQSIHIPWTTNICHGTSQQQQQQQQQQLNSIKYEHRKKQELLRKTNEQSQYLNRDTTGGVLGTVSSTSNASTTQKSKSSRMNSNSEFFTQTSSPVHCSSLSSVPTQTGFKSVYENSVFGNHSTHPAVVVGGGGATVGINPILGVHNLAAGQAKKIKKMSMF